MGRNFVYLQDLITLVRAETPADEKAQLAESLADAIVQYTGDLSERELITGDLTTLANPSSDDTDKFEAIDRIHDAMLEAASLDRPIQSAHPLTVFQRYDLEMAIQTGVQHLSIGIAGQKLDASDNIDQNAHTSPAKLTDVIREGFKHAPLIHLGDTDHASTAKAQAWLSDEQTLSELAEMGVSVIMLERSQIYQDLVDDLASGRVTKDEFRENMKAQGCINPFAEDPNAELDQIADLIVNASSEGIRVCFADPWDQTIFSEEFNADMAALQNPDIQADQKEVIGNRIIDAYLEDAGPAIRAFAEYRVNLLSDPDSSNIDKVHEAFRFNTRITGLRVGYDQELASFAHNTLQEQGGKALIWYGDGHGRYRNGMDFNDHLNELGTNSIRISIYENAEQRDFLYNGGQNPIEADLAEAHFILGEDGTPNNGTIELTGESPAEFAQTWGPVEVDAPQRASETRLTTEPENTLPG